MDEHTTRFRNPADVVREKTEKKPEIYEERHERVARPEEKRKREFLEQTADEGEQGEES